MDHLKRTVAISGLVIHQQSFNLPRGVPEAVQLPADMRTHVFVWSNCFCTNNVDTSVDQMLAYAPDKTAFQASSSLSLKEGCGLVVNLEPGVDVGHGIANATDDRDGCRTALQRFSCDKNFHVLFQVMPDPREMMADAGCHQER